MLSVGWEARIRCIGFWHRLLTDHQFHHHVTQRLAYGALVDPRRGQWVGKLRTCFEVFGWQDCAPLAGVLGGRLRQMMLHVGVRRRVELKPLEANLNSEC